MLRGSCLCGGVVYEIDAALGPAIYCHCSQCRKASGTAFATNASVPTQAFRFVSGADLLAEFESSPGNFRCFCSRCGSPIVKRMKAVPDSVRVRLGCLDSDPTSTPVEHLSVDSKAPWFEISDDLPQKS